jgi:DNA polymerase-3 subunit delta'
MTLSKISEGKLSWPLAGNKHIVDFLSKSVKSNNLAHSYVFCGPDNLGKTTTAAFFAQILLCENRIRELSSKASEFSFKRVTPCGQCSSCRKFLLGSTEAKEKGEVDLSGAHSDFYLIKKEKDKKNISIEQIREFIRKLGMSSFMNSYKVGIVKHANSLTIEAANALLKTLEEPKGKVVIILITSDIEAIPTTIVSRSQVLKFSPVSASEIYDYLVKDYGAARSMAKSFSLLCSGRPALAVKFLQDKEFYESYIERAKVFLSFFSQDINRRFDAIEKITKTQESAQETVKLAGSIIEIWLGLARDLLFIEFGRKDLIQHKVTEEEILDAKQKLKLGDLLNIINVLRQAREHLSANVNPKLILEQVAISI